MPDIIYPQLDGVKINENRTLPLALLQAIRKAYDYLAQITQQINPIGGQALQVNVIPKASGIPGVLVGSSLSDNGAAVTMERQVSDSTQPVLQVSDGVTVALGRLGRFIQSDRLDLTLNISYDGADFNLDDTGSGGAYLLMLNGTIAFYLAPAGPNPAVLVLAAQVVTGGLDVPTAYKVAGVQVVGAQLAAITPPSITTSTVSGTAGATYTATEQTMINALKTSVNQLNTDVINLTTGQADIASRLSTHGLTA